jgi:hypothetical protein
MGFAAGLYHRRGAPRDGHRYHSVPLPQGMWANYSNLQTEVVSCLAETSLHPHRRRIQELTS